MHLTVEAAAKDGKDGSNQSVPRYSLVVVDRKARGKAGPLAAFVVPIGQEHEWMFSSAEVRPWPCSRDALWITLLQL